MPQTATADERVGFESATLASSPVTRDVSANNTYDPLARKKLNLGTWIPLLVLGALVLWGIWIMTRPAPEEAAGTLTITSTSSQTDTGTAAAESPTETAPLAQLPPNIADPVNGLGAGDGSILEEIPASSADLTSQPGEVTPTAATSAAGETSAPGAQVSEREAINIVVTGVNRTNYYGVEAGCLGVGSSRFLNGGYTIELIARSCPGRDPGTLLGRWRVDGRTGDAYVQNARGKYVSP